MLPSAAGVDLSTLTKSLAGMEEVAETDEPWDFDYHQESKKYSGTEYGKQFNVLRIKITLSQ